MNIAALDRAGLEARSLSLWRLAAICFLLLKLVHLGFSGVFMDEAYYWLWGQHPALSYYDHPPVNAWMQGLAGALFGWNLFALRFMVVLTVLMDLGVLYLFARKFGGNDKQRYFWVTATLFLSTPIFFTVSGLAIPDHWLTVFCLASLYGFTCFVSDWRQGKSSYSMLYLGALCLGLATLSKYNAALLGIGFAAHVLLSRRLWPLFKDPHLYLAGLLSVAVQFPVLAWNVQQGFSSFQFVLSGRHAGLPEPFSLQGVVGFLLGALAFLGPFLLIPIYQALFSRGAGGLSEERRLARDVFLVSSVAILAASLATDVLFHWNAVAYIAVLPFLAPFFRHKWMQLGHVVYGVLFCALVIFNYAVMPVTSLVRYGDETSSWSYGWNETAAAVTEAKAVNGVTLVAATDYSIASPLAFALRDPGVISISERRDQFDYWSGPEELRGRDMLVIADSYRSLPSSLKARFSEVVLLREIPVERHGEVFDNHQIYLARNYQP